MFRDRFRPCTAVFRALKTRYVSDALMTESDTKSESVQTSALIIEGTIHGTSSKIMEMTGIGLW